MQARYNVGLVCCSACCVAGCDAEARYAFMPVAAQEMRDYCFCPRHAPGPGQVARADDPDGVLIDLAPYIAGDVTFPAAT